MDDLFFEEQLTEALVHEEAEFMVVHIDPDGSGLDWDGHLGAIITQARRCCANCTCIWGVPKNYPGYDIGPFVPGELKPLNCAARKIQDEINQCPHRSFDSNELGG